MSASSQPPLVDIFDQPLAAVESFGVGAYRAESYRPLLTPAAANELPDVLESFAALQPDAHMADGGTYRYRAYSRFSLEVTDGTVALRAIEGNSIFQSIEDNSLNGGVLRTYQPLAKELAEGALLASMIEQDFSLALQCDPSLLERPLVVGVHQVRIVARSRALGLPSPEGIHRDSERFTFQHFMARSGIDGGEFKAYDEAKTPVFSWLQEQCLDTVVFKGTTWHSATPIACAVAGVDGYRDIFLVDFDHL